MSLSEEGIGQARYILMAVYRAFESERRYESERKHKKNSERVRQLDSYMKAVKDTLICLQEYEREFIGWSKISSATDAETRGVSFGDLIAMDDMSGGK